MLYILEFYQLLQLLSINQFINFIQLNYTKDMTDRLQNIRNCISEKPKNRLQQYRQNGAAFNGKQLRDLLFQPGTYEKYILPSYQFMENNRDIFTHQNLEEYDRKQLRKEGAKMMLSWIKFLKIDIEKDMEQVIYAAYSGAAFDDDIVIKSFLHYFLYSNTIKNFQSNPSHKVWLRRAMELKDIGCFGLTEFYHGSYNKGMEMLANYDHEKKQFVLTSQGQKGMKFWIGGAAENATMAVIWAQLIVKGVSQGPHPFIVPLRCPKTHQVLPGVTLGDVGPKNGGNMIDNGIIMLDNVSIPKDNLLGKIGNVDQNGEYKSQFKTIDDRFGMHMSALSGGRGIFAFIVNAQVINTLTIALRYACSRKQFDNPQKTDEIPIIDYPITKIRIIPNLARTILYTAAGNNMARAYFSNTPTNKSLKYIAELHALSASIKVVITENSTATIAELRSILGGHGYSAFSAFSSIYHASDPGSTGEGDNNMLLQQTSKFLMRAISKKFPTLIVDLGFFHSEQKIDLESAALNIRSPQTLETLMRALFIQKYANAKATFAELLKKSGDAEEAWLHFHPRAGNALAITYANFYIYTVGRDKIAAAQSPRIRQFLTNALYLWAYTLLQREKLGPLELRKALQSEILTLCEEMAADAVLASDAMAPSSFIIGSPFADFEGEGMKEYLNLVYSAKNTFRRVENYRELVDKREKS